MSPSATKVFAMWPPRPETSNPNSIRVAIEGPSNADPMTSTPQLSSIDQNQVMVAMIMTFQFKDLTIQSLIWSLLVANPWLESQIRAEVASGRSPQVHQTMTHR